MNKWCRWQREVHRRIQVAAASGKKKKKKKKKVGRNAFGKSCIGKTIFFFFFFGRVGAGVAGGRGGGGGQDNDALIRWFSKSGIPP